MAVESALAGVVQVGTVVDNIINSDDKVKIAEYQAQGEIAKANALIAQAQAQAEAKAQAEADAKKAKTTYAIVGVLLLIGGVVAYVLLRPKQKPNLQYAQLQRPVMPAKIPK